MTAGGGVPSQMISGPDLGAGFLHQLSVAGEADPRTFTFHAQDGGSDAAGPPKGPLSVFGFVHPLTPCMFGGPRCWHRSFTASHADVPKVRLAYNRNRFVLQAMVDQAYTGVAADVEGALRTLLELVADPMRSEGIPWFLGGSAAAWLQGAAVRPNDIDLATNRAGVDRIGTLLAPYLIEPVALTDWVGPGSVYGARAFLGTFEKGARLEWAVPVAPGRATPFEEFGAAPEQVRTVLVRFERWDLRVSRPEYGLVRAAVKGRAESIRAIAPVVRARGPDLELLEGLLTRTALPEPARSAVRASVQG